MIKPSEAVDKLIAMERLNYHFEINVIQNLVIVEIIFYIDHICPHLSQSVQQRNERSERHSIRFWIVELLCASQCNASLLCCATFKVKIKTKISDKYDPNK